MFDAFGYLASVLVFMAFYMRETVPLRVLALCSNVAFIAYAAGLHLTPVLLLHVALLPINTLRLRQAFAMRRADGGVRIGAEAAAVGSSDP